MGSLGSFIVQLLPTKTPVTLYPSLSSLSSTSHPYSLTCPKVGLQTLCAICAVTVYAHEGTLYCIASSTHHSRLGQHAHWCTLLVDTPLSMHPKLHTAALRRFVYSYKHHLMQMLAGCSAELTRNPTYSDAGVGRWVLGQAPHTPQQSVRCAHTLAVKAWIAAFLWSMTRKG